MNSVEIILNELQALAPQIQQEQIEQMAQTIMNARHIFVVGAGRSGFCARGFSNRLLHLGFNVSFVGEPTTPRLLKEDLLLIASGSGKTGSLVSMANKAKEVGAQIGTFTINPEATIGAMANAVITIPGTTRLLGEDNNTQLSVQPIGSAFEQLLWITFDALIMELMKKTKQLPEDLISRHANLE
ncbi:MAG: SIS domain-containing protein [Erysipelotrichaceae bacterium]|nr:SIS domain-containing protein [Erysipelotrichaceae bacterium]